MTKQLWVAAHALIKLVRYHNINAGMGPDGFPYVGQRFCSLGLNETAYMAMGIMNCNVPSRIVCMMCQFCDQARRKMAVVEPFSVMNLE